MDAGEGRDAWPADLSAWRIDGADVVSHGRDDEERPGRDSLGNPGRVRVTRASGRLRITEPRTALVARYQERGLKPIRVTAAETELVTPRDAAAAAGADPFLLERSVSVVVRGREFPGAQRAAVEAKLATVRREAADASTSPERRAAAEKMLRDLEEGLASVIDVRAVERRFLPAVSVADPVESMGTVVALRAGSRIRYSVGSVRPAEGEDVTEDPMVFHLLALGAREVVMLYTGGVHGQRHVRDLDGSVVHNAWFANRERVRTDATAPWIGRRLFRSLADTGRGEIVIHRRRDAAPVEVTVAERVVHPLCVDGTMTEVPALRCVTACEDEMIVLDDAANPLVLRLVEAGAELLRTVDAVHTEPLPEFACVPLLAAEPVAAE
jgi:hypothetical protein